MPVTIQHLGGTTVAGPTEMSRLRAGCHGGATMGGIKDPLLETNAMGIRMGENGGPRWKHLLRPQGLNECLRRIGAILEFSKD